MLSINRQLIAPKLLYLIINVSLACLTPYLPLYYLHQGLTKTQVGLLGTFTPLLSFLGCPLWTLLADWSHGHKAILLFTLVVSVALRMAVYFLTGFKWLVVIVCANALVGAPVMPLIDAAVIRLLGENKSKYGRQRVFGSIGWGCAALGMGIVVDHYGIKYGFITHAATTVLVVPIIIVMGGFSHLGEHEQSKRSESDRTSDSDECIYGQEVDSMATPTVPAERPSWRAVCKLFADWQMGAFYLSIFLMGMSASVIGNFEFVYLESLGANESLMGLSLAVTCVAELPFFFFSGNMIARFGVRRVLYAVFVCFALRMFLYTLIDKPMLVLPIELLHGVTFGAMWSAGVAYAHEFAPPGLGSTTIGLFNGIYNGLGASCGALVGGLVYDHYGAKVLFRASSVASLVGFILFFVAQYLPRDPALAEKEALLGKVKKGTFVHGASKGQAQPPGGAEPGGVIASGGYQSFSDINIPVFMYGACESDMGTEQSALSSRRGSDLEIGPSGKGWRSNASTPRAVPNKKPDAGDNGDDGSSVFASVGDPSPDPHYNPQGAMSCVQAYPQQSQQKVNRTYGAVCANLLEARESDALIPAAATNCPKNKHKTRRRSVTASTSAGQQHHGSHRVLD